MPFVFPGVFVFAPVVFLGGVGGVLRLSEAQLAVFRGHAPRRIQRAVLAD